MYGPNPTRAPGKSFLIAVDRKTGDTRWQVERRTWMSAYSTPCLSRSVEGRPELIFTSTAHGITAVDPATGKVNWEIANLFRDRCVGSPVLAPGLVIAGYGAGTRGARIVAVRPGSRAKGLEPKLAYDLKRPVPLVPTPVVKDDRLFLWGDDGIVQCLEVSSGKLIWRERVGARFYGSPVWVSGRLYCISKKGEVVVLAAADKFELLARIPLGEASFATPAVADGVLYLRTRSQLLALGGKRP
jgi:outer membrane protein assembly factor BamB